MLKATLSVLILLGISLPFSADTPDSRVMRGGSWLDPPDLYRMAKRFAFAPQGRRDFLGFRVVMKAR